MRSISEKKFYSLRTIAVLLLVALPIVAVALWYFLKPSGEQLATAAPPAQHEPLAVAREARAGYKEYRNETYRFALLYPEDLTVKEYNEGGGAMTVTFENRETVQGFQIFVVPYAAPEISAEQFKRDSPSGVVQEPRTIALDGTPGTIFFSIDPLLGETRELWVIHGGYLFEVTAHKSLDEWLGTIMLTWKFI